MPRLGYCSKMYITIKVKMIPIDCQVKRKRPKKRPRIFLGIIGEYLLRIYLILRSEPVAIIEKSLNFDPEDLKL